MANVIEQATQAIRARLAQLEELIAEQQQLKKALDTLEGLTGARRGKDAARPTRRGNTASGAPRALPRSGPSRAEQFVALVSEQPGITVAEAAKRLNASRQTLYNVSARLQREGRLRKDGRGFTRPREPLSQRRERALAGLRANPKFP